MSPPSRSRTARNRIRPPASRLHESSGRSNGQSARPRDHGRDGQRSKTNSMATPRSRMRSLRMPRSDRRRWERNVGCAHSSHEPRRHACEAPLHRVLQVRSPPLAIRVPRFYPALSILVHGPLGMDDMTRHTAQIRSFSLAMVVSFLVAPLSIPAANAARPLPPDQDPLVQNMDPKVSPGADFFQYAN